MGTKTVVLSRDVIWLNKLYFHYKNSLKAENIQSCSFTEKELGDTFDKTSVMRSQKQFEPATNQEGEVEEAEEKEDEKLAASEDQEPIDNRVHPEHPKRFPWK